MTRLKYSRFALTVPVALVLSGTLLLSGCSGGGGGSHSQSLNNVPTANDVAGNSAFQTAVTNSAGGTLDVTDLTTANSDFSTALGVNPNDSTANVGFAITLSGILFGGSGAVQSNAVAGHAALSPHDAHVASAVSALSLSNLSGVVSGSGTIAGLTIGDLLPQAHQSALIAHLNTAQVVSGLAAIQADLQLVINNEPSNYVFPYPIQVSVNPAQSDNIGIPELEALSTAVAVVQALIDTSGAYDLSTTSADTNTPLFTELGVSGSGQLSTSTATPADYLPASPFGTLTANGAQLLQSAHSSLQLAANESIAAVTGIQTRVNTGFLIQPGAGADLDTVKTGLQEFKSALNGTTAIHDPSNPSGTQVAVNLSQPFLHPVQNLESLFPTYTIVAVSSNEVQLTNPVYPDPTFDGLVPQGALLLQEAGNEGPLDVYSSETLSDYINNIGSIYGL